MRWVFRICAAILLVAAAFKLNSALYEIRLLGVANPLLDFLSNRQVLVVAAVVEIAVAWVLLSAQSNRSRAFYLSWIVAVFISYRGGLWLIRAPEPCGCLGSIGQWLGISDAATNMLSLITLSVLAVAACFACGVEACRILQRDVQGEGKTGSN
jgi:hypothetical protein